MKYCPILFEVYLVFSFLLNEYNSIFIFRYLVVNRLSWQIYNTYSVVVETSKAKLEETHECLQNRGEKL